MAVVPFVRFNAFLEAAMEKKHNLGSDSLKWVLTNTAPDDADTQLSDITEISAGAGYTSGGFAVTVTSSAIANTNGYRLILQDTTLTASGGTIGPFRYAVLYNDTASNNDLIGYLDYGASIILDDGGSLILDCDPSNGIFTVY